MNVIDTGYQLINSIDFILLQEQKRAILTSKIEESLKEGLLSLIDNIQDYAVEKLHKDEKVVFEL